LTRRKTATLLKITIIAGVNDPAGGIDHYIHSYYENIEPIYRQRVYKIL
jgi:integrase/recombinase XerD